MKYMLTENEAVIAEEWKKYKGYTIRPLNSTIRYYQSLIAFYPNLDRALLYGGTPEIRDIFQAVNAAVTLVDRSAQMIAAMGTLTDAAVPLAANESFVQADWLSLDSLEPPYDLLIGDDAINMVHWHQFEMFLQNAHRLLKSGGFFICHLLLKPDDDLINQGVNDLALAFNQGIIRSSYDLASRLNYICYDKPTYGMGWQQTIQKLGKEALAQFMPNFDFYALFNQCNSRFYCPPQIQFEQLVQQYFYIEELFYPHEHDYCHDEPVYLLKK